MFGVIIQSLQDAPGGLHRSLVTNNAKTVAAIIDFNTQMALQQAQMLVGLTTQIGQPRIIRRLEFELTGFELSVQTGLILLVIKDKTRSPAPAAGLIIHHAVN